MSGSTLIGMGAGSEQFTASEMVEGWPSWLSRCHWDQRNAATLLRDADGARGSAGDRLIQLAHRLRPNAGNGSQSPIPTSMASTRRRWLVADRLGAHVSDVCARLVEQAHFCTIIPRYGEVNDPDELDPRTFIERLRNDLNDAGAIGSDGIIFAVLEAEYHMRTNKWFYHMHLVASGGKLRAINALRRHEMYHTPRRRPDEPKAAVSYRIKVSKRPLYDLPKPVTYCIKPWCARWSDPDGERSRRKRIPAEAVSAMLLWQDKWSFADVTLLMGMRPGRSGLIVFGSTRMHGSIADEPLQNGS